MDVHCFLDFDYNSFECEEADEDVEELNSNHPLSEVIMIAPTIYWASAQRGRTINKLNQTSSITYLNGDGDTPADFVALNIFSTAFLGDI